jgi:serine/threonine-protein kinase
MTLGTKAPTLVGEKGRASYSLPISLLEKASRRLQILCAIGITLILIGWIGVNLVEGELVHEFQNPLQWAPNAVIFLASVLVLTLARSSRLPLTRIVTVGLVYEVVISYCIPLGEYWGVFRGIETWYINSDVVGFSGVAIWMIFFTILVPSRPRSALIALTLSGSAVPVTVGYLIWLGDIPALQPLRFFFTFILPYILCIILTYLAARFIYNLGQEVGRAQELGSYRLTSLIGRGGMGEVWHAHHAMLARPAAIKLIRPDALGTNPALVQAATARFEQEAQVTASLQSPHTVALYDFGTSEDGSLYYVMELLDGIDLESMVQRYGPLTPERTVYVLRQACHSLGEAHRQGLVHRDIKPSNIFLCRQAFDADVVKVLDFGLVKRLSDIDTGIDLTKAGPDGIVGTPSYLPPEIALGRDRVDGRADIYGLGCVAFWMLTGRRVFEEDSTMAMILAHVHTVPTPPSAASEIQIPPELDELVLACLAKDRELRPESADELVGRLDKLNLKRPWTKKRAVQWWELNRPKAGFSKLDPAPT